MTRASLSCRDLVDFLDDYLLEALPAGRRQAFEAHLRQCPSCDGYTKTYVAATLIAKAAVVFENEPVPAEVSAEFVRAIVSARRASS